MRIVYGLTGVCAVSAACALVILAGIYPWRPNTAAAWLALFFLALPSALVTELISGQLLQAEFVAKMNRGARIALGVVVGSLWIVALIALTRSTTFNDHFGKW